MVFGVAIMALISGIVCSGIGGGICVLLKKMSIKVESMMLSFAAGVMLAIVCFDLIPEAIDPHDLDGGNIPWVFIISMVLGFYLIYLLNSFIHRRFGHDHCPAHSHHNECDDDCVIEEEKHHKISHLNKDKCYGLLMAGVVMAIAISFHNFPEGIVIGASYAGGSGVLLSGSGFLISVMVGLHNIPAGVAISAPLVSGGMKKIKAVSIASLTGITTVIGAVIGYLIGSVNETCLSILLGLASGTILNVVFCDLLPESIIMWRSKITAWFLFIGLILGILLINV